MELSDIYETVQDLLSDPSMREHLKKLSEEYGEIYVQAYAEGYIEGYAKGIQSEKRETALRLSKMGLSIKQIAQATELSEDDVLKLIQK